MDYRDGAMGASFIHDPLLVFHEAGHVIFAIFGEWGRVLGCTPRRLPVPAIPAWICLFDSVNRLHHAQCIGTVMHAPGVAIVLLALARGAGALRLQGRRLAGRGPVERRRP